jgi:hypothetical protein
MLLEAESHKPKAESQYEFETLVVKLLRAYGECLGARSR